MIRLAFIGFGAFARRYHLPALEQADDVSVTFICDPSAAPELVSAAAKFDAKLTQRMDDLWDSSAGNAVIITTPHTLHAEQTRAALEHGKHVLVDKPFVMKDAEAQELSELATKLSLINGVAFTRRFDPGCLRAREIIREGGVGPVRAVEAVQLGYERAGWFLVPELGGGGPFTGRASHIADLVPWLVGVDPSDVRGRLRQGPPGRSDHGGFIDIRFSEFDCRITCIEVRASYVGRGSNIWGRRCYRVAAPAYRADRVVAGVDEESRGSHGNDAGGFDAWGRYGGLSARATHRKRSCLLV